jgi:hypothetical protein
MAILVPGCRAGKEDLDDDTCEIDVAEGAAVDGQGAGGGEDEEDDCCDGGAAEVHDAVGEPGEDVEDDVLVGGEDVGEVGAVEDVFEGGEDAHPDAGAGFAGDEAGDVSWGRRRRGNGGAYRAAKKKMTQVSTGSAGMRNWLVIGITAATIASSIIPALIIGADGVIAAEKSSIMTRKMFCAS